VKTANRLVQDLFDCNKENLKQSTRLYNKQISQESIHQCNIEIEVDIKDVKHRRQSRVQNTRINEGSGRKSTGKYNLATVMNLSMTRGRSR
jgi:hypothetical protein